MSERTHPPHQPRPRRRRALATPVAALGLVVTLLLASTHPGAAGAGTDGPAAPRDLPAPTQQFADVPTDHPFFADIAWLAAERIGQGYPDGTFAPTQPVSRGAMAAFLARYAGAVPEPCAADAFPDVTTEHLFCAEITWLADTGITGGFADGTFRPATSVSRQSMAAFLRRLVEPDDPAACTEAAFPDVAIDHPFCAEITWLADTGITGGFADGTFRPATSVSRQSMAAFLGRLDAFEARPVPSPGCGTSEVGPLLHSRVDLQVGGTDRWYLLTTPEAHDGETPLPLVLDLHGLAEGAEIHTLMSNYSPLAQAEGFVVAFPHGTGNPVRWNPALNTTTNPDLVYLDALLDDLGDDLCIDLSRVYATGLSMGAFMTSTMACVWADRIAAAAPVAGIQRPTGCAPSRPMPMLSYHGTDDQILLFNGGVGTLPLAAPGPIDGPADPLEPARSARADLDGPGYPANVAAWAAGNGCDPVATDTQETDEVIRRVYDCPRGADVEFTIVLGGGHTWPGSEFSQAIAAVVGHTTFDADATAEAWAFFQRFHR